MSNLKEKIEALIEEYSKENSYNDIQEIIMSVLKEKTDYDNDYIILMDDKTQLTFKIEDMEKRMSEICNKLDISNKELMELRKKNDEMQDIIENLNKPSFIKDVDKTIIGLGKEIEKGVNKFGDFMSSLFEESNNNTNEREV